MRELKWLILQLDLALKDDKGGDISSFIPNGEWDLIGNDPSSSPSLLFPWVFVKYHIVDVKWNEKKQKHNNQEHGFHICTEISNSTVSCF